MDVIFCEVIEFTVRGATYFECRNAPSQEEVLRELMETMGIELIDYGSFKVMPIGTPNINAVGNGYLVSVYSKAFRERVERDAMAGRY
jgi:hypothetical protein